MSPTVEAIAIVAGLILAGVGGWKLRGGAPPKWGKR